MSLRIWLPLTKDLRNQGLDNVTVTNNGATFNSTGKLGGCYQFGPNKNIKLMEYASTFSSFNEFSLSVWFKCTAQNTGHSGSALISCGDWNQSTHLLNLALCYYNTDHYTILLITNNSGWSYGYSYNFQLNTWYHVVLTTKQEEVKAYVNGELIGNSANAIVPTDMAQNWICIGNATYYSSFTFNGFMNDVRIYDHALSPLEVKQISQGLILHYPLNNVIGGLSRLWSLASYTRSIDLTTSYAYVYSIPGNTVWLTPGKQYTVAAEIKVNQNNILFYFDSNCTDANGVYSGNDAAQTVQYNPTVNLEKDKWVPVYITTTIKNDAGKPYYHHGFLFRTNSGTLTTNCEIKNIEVYEGDLKLRRGLLPTDITEYDCSGFGNNGTRIGTFSWTSNTPKYAVSQVFNGTNNAIQTPSLPSMISDKNYTIAVWIYKTVIGSKGYQTIYGGPSGFEIEARNGGANETKFVPWNWGKPMASYELNEWNHCVFVHSDSDCKIYLNGEYIATGSAKASNPSGNYFVGAWNTATQQNFDGLMSDFRIYATALSADDIKSLYQNSAYIDNQGNIYGAVYEEV